MYTNLDETKIRGLTDRGHSETETRHAAHRIVLVKVKKAPLTPVTFDALNILLKKSGIRCSKTVIQLLVFVDLV